MRSLDSRLAAVVVSLLLGRLDRARRRASALADGSAWFVATCRPTRAPSGLPAAIFAHGCRSGPPWRCRSTVAVQNNETLTEQVRDYPLQASVLLAPVPSTFAPVRSRRHGLVHAQGGTTRG